MHKDFDGWNQRKKQINSRSGTRYYHAREIWWCALGMNIGSEQDGSLEGYSRPVLILRGFGRDTCLIIGHKIGLIEDQEATALLSQLRAIDTRRLIRKIGMLKEDIFVNIQKSVRDLL